jgi:hypothetical protein
MGKHDKPNKKEKTDKDENKPALVFKLPCKNPCSNDCPKCGYFWVKYLDDGGAEYTPARWTQGKVEKKLYTADSVREAVQPKWDGYFYKLALGQALSWKCDQRTAELFCLNQWIMEELITLECPHEARIAQQQFFNRKCRALNDLYELAAVTVNMFLTGNIDQSKNRYSK